MSDDYERDEAGIVRDRGHAPERWEFNQEVTDVFDDMLDRSIPQYETMREAVCNVASAFATPGSAVIDLGCSTGTALATLRAKLGDGSVSYVGLETSAPMISQAEHRFAGAEDVEIVRWDLRGGVPTIALAPPSVVLSVLTLMFVPVNYRSRILRDVALQLHAGGALVLVEKVIGESTEIDDVLTANYHQKKFQSGYTPDEIERKRLSLEGVLVPLTASWNVQMLLSAGFRSIENFWSWMNFRGWVAVR
jgi:tRNA (cmo5U34)-methyltransferase